jgi:hypothetical protein
VGFLIIFYCTVAHAPSLFLSLSCSLFGCLYRFFKRSKRGNEQPPNPSVDASISCLQAPLEPNQSQIRFLVFILPLQLAMGAWPFMLPYFVLSEATCEPTSYALVSYRPDASYPVENQSKTKKNKIKKVH